MKSEKSPSVVKRCREASFTLFETVIALMIMSVMMIEMTNLQGNNIYFSEYGSNVVRGVWLAKRVMSQVEYYWRSKPFSEIKLESRDDVPFEDYPDFKYKLNIKEWKLPLLDFVAGGGVKEEEDKGPASTEETSEKPEENTDMIGTALKQFFGDEEPLKVAHVEVSWAEGAQRNSVSLTYLLTNQKKIDDFLETNKGVYEELQKSERQAGGPTPTPSATPPSGPAAVGGASTGDSG